MPQFSDDLCCDLTMAVGGSTDACDKLPGGIEDVRIGCLKYFSDYTEGDCNVNPSTAYVTSITATDPQTLLAVTPLWRATIKRKTGEHEFGATYDNDTDTNTFDSFVNFEIVGVDVQARCAIKQYIGQEVVVMFKYRRSRKWWMEGWKGGLRVSEIRGGSGLDNRRRTAWQITGADLEDIFQQFFVTDDDTTDLAVEALTN